MRRNGFTLLEVLLSTAIFVLLAGGIFTAVSVSLTASSAVTLARWDSERLDAMQRLLQKLFSSTPANSRFELRVRSVAGKTTPELLLSEAPAWAAFTRASGERGIAICSLPEAGGSTVLSVANFNSEESTDRRDAKLQEAAWMKLLPNVRGVRWRFAKADSTGGLQETWEAGEGRPAMVNLEFQMTDGSSHSWFFDVPRLQAAPSPKVEGEKS